MENEMINVATEVTEEIAKSPMTLKQKLIVGGAVIVGGVAVYYVGKKVVKKIKAKKAAKEEGVIVEVEAEEVTEE